MELHCDWVELSGKTCSTKVFPPAHATYIQPDKFSYSIHRSCRRAIINTNIMHVFVIGVAVTTIKVCLVKNIIAARIARIALSFLLNQEKR